MKSTASHHGNYMASKMALILPGGSVAFDARDMDNVFSRLHYNSPRVDENVVLFGRGAAAAHASGTGGVRSGNASSRQNPTNSTVTTNNTTISSPLTTTSQSYESQQQQLQQPYQAKIHFFQGQRGSSEALSNQPSPHRYTSMMHLSPTNSRQQQQQNIVQSTSMQRVNGQELEKSRGNSAGSHSFNKPDLSLSNGNSIANNNIQKHIKQTTNSASVLMQDLLSASTRKGMNVSSPSSMAEMMRVFQAKKIKHEPSQTATHAAFLQSKIQHRKNQSEIVVGIVKQSSQQQGNDSGYNDPQNKIEDGQLQSYEQITYGGEQTIQSTGSNRWSKSPRKNKSAVSNRTLSGNSKSQNSTQWSSGGNVSQMGQVTLYGSPQTSSQQHSRSQILMSSSSPYFQQNSNLNIISSNFNPLSAQTSAVGSPFSSRNNSSSIKSSTSKTQYQSLNRPTSKEAKQIVSESFQQLPPSSLSSPSRKSPKKISATAIVYENGDNGIEGRTNKQAIKMPRSNSSHQSFASANSNTPQQPEKSQLLPKSMSLANVLQQQQNIIEVSKNKLYQQQTNNEATLARHNKKALSASNQDSKLVSKQQIDEPNKGESSQHPPLTERSSQEQNASQVAYQFRYSDQKSSKKSYPTTDLLNAFITAQRRDYNHATFSSINKSASSNIQKEGSPLKKNSSKQKTNQKSLGTIAQHPDQLYYLQNLADVFRNPQPNDGFSQLCRQHFQQTCQGVVFANTAKPQNPRDLTTKRVTLGPRDKKFKKTLVFDMDETLIHCNESVQMPSDIVVDIKFPTGESLRAGVNVRPYAREILKELSEEFEIIIFTASHMCYAQSVIDNLDPTKKHVHHRFFRDHCIQTPQGVYVKDLRIFSDRKLSEIVLIDNAAYSFSFQIDNGIPIYPFYDNKTDKELAHLVSYLRCLHDVSDVREYNKRYLKMSVFNDVEGPQKVFSTLFAKSQ